MGAELTLEEAAGIRRAEIFAECDRTLRDACQCRPVDTE
jgi:hypothetical protein